jgi:hypothetical protein
MSLSREYNNRIKLFFQRFIHNEPYISHRQAEAEQYVLRNTSNPEQHLATIWRHEKNISTPTGNTVLNHIEQPDTLTVSSQLQSP